MDRLRLDQVELEERILTLEEENTKLKSERPTGYLKFKKNCSKVCVIS